MFAGETYQGIDYWSKLLDEKIGFKTYEYDSGNDIIITNKITWQGEFGYIKWYDSVFHRYTKSDNDQIDIGNGYKIWLWKGDYLNLGAGGEIGIYNTYGGDGDVVGTTMSEKLGIKMTMNITDKSGNSIVNINNQKSIIDYITGYEPNEQWWITGWNPSKQGLTDKDLILTGEIDFSKDETTQAMYNSLKNSEQKYQVKSNIEYLDNYRIRITW